MYSPRKAREPTASVFQTIKGARSSQPKPMVVYQRPPTVFGSGFFKMPRVIHNTLRVLVACEFSGVVRRAFRSLGHEAWSCDLIDAYDASKHHIKRDAIEAAMYGEWDLLIAHPPCTHLASSGASHFHKKGALQQKALAFVEVLLALPIPRIALENPIGVISTRLRKPDQIIHPWQFGHGETKATCLWLKCLPLLQPTHVVDGRETRIRKMPPGPMRRMKRSITYQGIADAMASQWGCL